MMRKQKTSIKFESVLGNSYGDLCSYSRVYFDMVSLLIGHALVCCLLVSNNPPNSAPSTSVWYAYVDNKSGVPYYHNPLTEETTWIKPEGSEIKIVAQEHAGNHQIGEEQVDSDKFFDAVSHESSRYFALNVVAGVFGMISAFFCGCIWINRPFEEDLKLAELKAMGREEFSQEAKELKAVCDEFHLKANDPQTVTIQEVGLAGIVCACVRSLASAHYLRRFLTCLFSTDR
jgi:hypothetical protein